MDHRDADLRVGQVPDSLGPLLERVVDTVNRRRPVRGCDHLSGRPSPLLLCAQHPAEGFRCHRCATRHARVHGVELEASCDVCGDLAHVLHSALLTTVASGVLVEDRSSRRYRVGGIVLVHSVGICTGCHRVAA